MPLPRVLEPEVMSGAEEAVEYDEMDFSATDQLFAERAAELATAAAVTLIADLGSGNAKIPLAMCPLLPATRRPEMSAEIYVVAVRNRTRHGVGLHLVAADAKHVPFANQSIGMITSNSLKRSTHIPDPRAVFQEIARIARPRAPILIRDLVRPENQQALEQLVEAHAAPWSPLQRTLFADSLHAALTLPEVRQMLDQCGLADVTVAQITDRHWSAERAPGRAEPPTRCAWAATLEIRRAALRPRRRRVYRAGHLRALRPPEDLAIPIRTRTPLALAAGSGESGHARSPDQPVP